MKTQEEIEQLAKAYYSYEYGEDTSITDKRRVGYVNGYTQCQEYMADEISRFLRENLKVVIKQDHKFSNRTEANFDVIVMLEGEEISTTDFTIYS